MPSKSEYSGYTDNGLGYMYYGFTRSYTWQHSPRAPDGKLLLRANTLGHTKVTARISALKLTTNQHDRRAIYGNSDVTGGVVGKYPFFEQAIVNRSYGLLVKTLRGQTASLGVTLGTWKESLAMIVLRSAAITKFAKKCEKEAARRNRAARRTARRNRTARLALRRLRAKQRQRRENRKGQSLKPYLPIGSANLFLEGVFGWLPLLSDIYQAMRAMTDDLPGGWISGSARGQMQIKPPIGYFPPGGSMQTFEGAFRFRVSQTCFVKVNNPNIWLANKMGLINPALVVWDRVPWSFAVNWFTNIPQVLGSFTDFAGITVSNASTTRKWETNVGWTARSLPGYDQIMETGTRKYEFKHRQLGLMLPQLQARIPRVDMTSALISVSLMAQQLSRLKFS